MLVDLDVGADGSEPAMDRLREAPPALLLDTRHLVVRAPLDADEARAASIAEQARTLLDELGSPAASVHVLRAGVGRPHVLVSPAGDPPPDVVDRLIRRSRAAEVHALVLGGRALWAPRDHHFRVPSGQHSDTFLRMGDAVTVPRDALALASWTGPALRPGLAVLTDSRSLTPLVLGLQSLAAQAGLPLGRTGALAQYASNRDADAAVRDVAAEEQGVLVLLSVSSGGTARGLLRTALGRNLGGTVPWSLQVLADRAEDPTAVSDAPARPPGRLGLPEEDTWAGYANLGPAVSDVACASCRDPERARLVQIDPRGLDELTLPDPDLTVPDPLDAQSNSGLWGACDRSGAVTLQAPPHGDVLQRRAKGRPMSVVVDFARLVGSSTFPAALDLALSDRLAPLRGGAGDPPAARDLRGCDLLLVDERDRQVPGFDAVLAVLRERLGPEAAVQAVPTESVRDPDGWPAAALDAIREADHVVVFALGTVTGLTMQRMLVGVQSLRRPTGDYVLAGLVAHARTATLREWQTLHNSYGRRLHAVWNTLLPDSSPLDDESEGALDDLEEEALRGNDPGWDEDLLAFVSHRREVCAGRWNPHADDPGYLPVLWGMPSRYEDRTRVRQQSIFGDRIGAQALFAAVGAAVRRAREGNATGARRWRVFELPAVARSYYDPLILASVLRWTGPHEVWWGRSDRDASRAVSDILGRAVDEDKKVLLPELLLASHLGRLPRAAARDVLAAAEAVLAAPGAGWERQDLVPLRAGAVLARPAT